jgi:PAS domain S-box-containing protein
MLKTLRGKITLVYMGLVLLIAIVGSVSVINLIYLEKSVNGLMTHNYRSISAADNMLYALQQQDNALLTYINVDNKKGIDIYFTNKETFTKYFNIAANNVTEKNEQNVIGTIRKDYAQFDKSNALLQETQRTGGEQAAVAYYRQSVTPLLTDIRQNLKQLIAINQTAMFRSKNEASQKARTSVYTLLGVSLLAVAGGFLISRFFVNRFSRPIQLLAEGLSRVKAGELGLKLDIQTGDETGMLAQEFNQMTKRLALFEQSTLGTLMSERNKSLAIVKSISDPLIVLDDNCRIVLINSAGENFFNIKEDQAVGRHLLEVIHNIELFDQITGSGRSAEDHTEKIMFYKRERGYYFNTIVTPVKDPPRKAAGYIVLMQDVTKLKELERVKTEFTATVSHEFKTPLTSILMGASMLGDRALGDLSDEQAEVVGTIIEDGEKLSDLVEELLQISRIESGKAIYSFAACSLNEVVEESCRQFAEKAKRANVALINRLESGLPPVYADFERITWVMNNLLSNALKYTKAGDSIAVTAAIKDAYLEVTVTDTGEGIPAEYLDRIFDRFVQVRGRDIEVRGTGLGLSVAQEIITAHRGLIDVESEVGRGSSFRFTLPLAIEGMQNGGQL